MPGSGGGRVADVKGLVVMRRFGGRFTSLSVARASEPTTAAAAEDGEDSTAITDQHGKDGTASGSVMRLSPLPPSRCC